MQGKTLYTILLAIIAVLTLALAVMIIFLYTAFNGTSAAGQITERKTIQRIVPPEEQAEFNICAAEDASGKTDALFSLKNSKDHSNSFLMASISVIYDVGKKGKFLEERKVLFGKTYLSQLKQATIEYFREKSFDDLQPSDAMQKSREDLKEIYSQIISESTDEQIILRIVFDKWILQ